MKTLTFLLIIFSFSAFAQDASVRIDEINQKLNILKEMMPKTPYKQEQHEAIKGYFVDLKDFFKELDESRRLKQRFNNLLSEEGQMKDFCTKVLIDSETHIALKKNCTRNRFFLCSEEVNSFEEYKKSISTMMDEENLSEFTRTIECM